MYGQGQAGGGIVLDLRETNRVGPVADGQVTVQAGALWREVLAATLPYGRTPPVLTDYLGASVGGVLSRATRRGRPPARPGRGPGPGAGGGDRGRGAPVLARPGSGPVPRGARRLGQCAVIVAATLRLVPAPARVRRHCLYHADLTRYLADQRRLAEEQGFSCPEGQARPAGEHGWQ